MEIENVVSSHFCVCKILETLARPHSIFIFGKIDGFGSRMLRTRKNFLHCLRDPIFCNTGSVVALPKRTPDHLKTTANTQGNFPKYRRFYQMAKMKYVTCSIAILLVLVTISLGQTSKGFVVGNIADPNGAAVPAATVKVTNTRYGSDTRNYLTRRWQLSFRRRRSRNLQGRSHCYRIQVRDS